MKAVCIHVILFYHLYELSASNYKKIISVEEHNIIGGLGSSIADVIATNNLNTKLYKIGINDTFAKGYGTYQEMKEMNNLDSESIYKEVKKILSN